MSYLLDTHIFVWIAMGQLFKIPNAFIGKMEDKKNSFFVSRCSLWEIAIKNRDGKFDIGEPYPTLIRNIRQRFGIKILEINNNHLITLNSLEYPKEHKDPFDHLIISQALSENLHLVSVDGKFPFYRSQGLKLMQ